MPSRAGKKLLKAAEARPHTDASTLGVLTNFVLNLRGPSYISSTLWVLLIIARLKQQYLLNHFNIMAETFGSSMAA